MKHRWRNFPDLVQDDVPQGIDQVLHDPKVGQAKLVGAWKYSEAVLKCRYENAKGEKTCRWLSSTPDGWRAKLSDDFTSPLYGLDSLREGLPAFLVEGEKAAAALHRLAVSAVGLAGTSHADTADPSLLAGRNIILWPDNDDAGHKAMDIIAARLDRAHKRVDPKKLDLPEKGDAADIVAGLITAWGVNGWDGTTPFPRDAGDDWADALMERIEPAIVNVQPRLAWETLPVDWLTALVPDRDFVFRGAVPVGCVTLLLATGGGGKSMLCLTLAVSVAAGLELLRGFPPTQTGRVAVVNLEDDIREVYAWLQRIAREHNLSNEDADFVRENLRILSVATLETLKLLPDGVLTEGTDLASLRRSLADIGPRLVVLDPLAALLGGVVDENDNAAAQAVVGVIRNAMPTDAGILVAAHVSKAEKESSNTARGASAWQDASRMALALRPLDSKEQTNIPQGDDKYQYMALEIRKSNYAPMRRPVYLRRSTNSATAGALSVVDFDAMRSRADQAIRDAVLAVLRKQTEGITRREAAGNVSGKTAAREEALERGRVFRDAVIQSVGSDVSCKRMDAVINAMLKDGSLDQTHSGKRLVLTVPGTGSDESTSESK